MRSGRGKCPQCKETIVVDLDAPEIRCPLCGALLKKSKKTVEEVRAEEQARIAAAEARERALRGEPEEAPVETPVVPAEPVAETVPETPAEPVAETPVEETPETPAEAPVDEIGMTDEELAAMDENIPAEEEAPAEAPVDEIGMTDEELAAMDEAVPEDVAAEETPAEDIPVEEPADEIGMTDEELAAMDAPAMDVPAESEEAEPTEETYEGMASPSAPVEEEPADEEPEETIPEESAPAEETPVEETPVEEVPAEEEAPVEETPVEEAPAEEVPAEESVAEEAPIEVEEPAEASVEVEEAPEAVEEAPTEAEPAEDVAPETEESTENAAAYTDEDMAFAASLSDGIVSNKGEKKGAYVAPVVKEEPKSEKKKRDKKKKSDARKKKDVAPEGDLVMKGTAIYKKPIAAVMFAFSILAAVIFFLYKGLLGAVSEELAETIFASLPEFSGALVDFAFYTLILVIAALGLTGKRCKGAFVFLLILAIVNLGEAVFYGGGTPILTVKFLKNLFHDLSKTELIYYGTYGALFIAMIIFGASFGRGKRTLETPGSAPAVPVVYMLLVIIAYVAIVALPILMALEKLPENIGSIFSTYIDPYVDPYAIWGIWGLSVLLTLVGVHNKTLSRGVNAWMLFANLMIVTIFVAVQFVLDFLGVAKAGIDTYSEILEYTSPLILLVSFAGFTASDLRN